jgi:hypothetical protein
MSATAAPPSPMAPPTRFYRSRSRYYKDPEGNFVELQSDVFSNWKLSTEYMRSSPEFAENPIGVFFDPARVYDTFKSGTEFRP